MVAAITKDLRTAGRVPKGYVTLSNFAKAAGCSKTQAAKALSNGNIPLNRACAVKGPGRWGQVIYIDASFAADFAEYRKGTPKVTAHLKAKGAKTEQTGVVSSETFVESSEPVAQAFGLGGQEGKSKAHWDVKRAQIKAIREGLELQKARNDVMSVKQMVDLVAEICLTIRQNMVALPGRVCAVLAGENDAGRIRVLLDTEIREALIGLARLTGKVERRD